MSTLIKNKSICENDWQIILEEETSSALTTPGKILISLELWFAHQSDLQQKISDGEVGIYLSSEKSINDLPENYLDAALIAIDFPKFVDGRGYTIARELRQKLAYKKEIRAVGEVLHDQINAMLRMGFNAFELSDEHNAESALLAFDDFQTNYQADVHQTLPVYAR